MSTYTQRTLPNGQVKEQGPYPSKRLAVSAAGYVLTDNLGLRRRDAEPIMFQIENSPLGTDVAAYGYTFRLLAS